MTVNKIGDSAGTPWVLAQWFDNATLKAADFEASQLEMAPPREEPPGQPA